MLCIMTYTKMLDITLIMEQNNHITKWVDMYT